MEHLEQAVGNTKTTACKSRRFCFTLNNPSKEETEYIIKTLEQKSIGFIIGQEVGDLGTPHLQGYMEFKNPVSFQSLKKMNNRLHLEKTLGNKQQNIEYCSKQHVLISTFPLPLKITLLNKYENTIWKEWQQKIINIIESNPNDRTIYWVFDPIGNTGKSYLCKYLYLKYDCIIADGKKDNVFNQIKIWMDNHPEISPKLSIIDIPRHNIEYINYGTLEQIKNGLIYSGKYEGGICIFESPHVFVFANELPDFKKFSKDRLHIIET